MFTGARLKAGKCMLCRWKSPDAFPLKDLKAKREHQKTLLRGRRRTWAILESSQKPVDWWCSMVFPPIPLQITEPASSSSRFRETESHPSETLGLSRAVLFTITAVALQNSEWRGFASPCT